MGILRSIKQSILTRLLSRPAVLDAATGVILADPQRAHRIVANPEQFPQILEAISKSQQAATMALDHPEVRKRIVRNPAFFEAMLDHTAHQPEALARILGRRDVRKNLSAQKRFLSGMANEQRVMAELLKVLPSRHFQSALTALLDRHRSQIETLEGSTEAFATALMTGVERDPKTRSVDVDPEFVDLLAARLGDNIVPILQAIVVQRPDVMVRLLRSSKMRDLMVLAVSEDTKSIQATFSTYILDPSGEQSSAERAAELVTALTTDPVFLRAAGREPEVVSSFLQTNKIRDLLIMSADKGTLQELFRQYVATPAAGRSIPERIATLMNVIMSDPVFVRALSRNPDLQVQVVNIVTDTFDHVGEDIVDVRNRTKTGTKTGTETSAENALDNSASTPSSQITHSDAAESDAQVPAQ